MRTKSRRRHTPDQIIRKLAEGQRLLVGGQGLDEVCRRLDGRRVDLALGLPRFRGHLGCVVWGVLPN